MLSDAHLKSLTDSGLSEEAIASRGYRTVDTKAELRRLGFGIAQQLVPCLLVPLYGPKGESVGHQIKPDAPRTKAVPGKKPRVLKYETPSGTGNVVDVPPAAQHDIDDPKVPLWITEGAKKADSACLNGLCCVDLSGVWNWRHTNPKGGKVELPFWDGIALNGRTIYVAFDSDAAENDGVWQAMVALGTFLERKGAHVRYVSIPTPDGRKVGLDDWFVGGGKVEGLLAVASAVPPTRPGTTSPEDGDWGDEPPPQFDPTDAGNGDRLASLYGDRLRHCSDWDVWIHATESGVWRTDAPGAPEARELAKASARLLVASTNETFQAWGRQSLMSSRINSALREAQSLPTIRVRSTELDAHPRLLGCPNGVVDLATGEFEPNPTGLLVTRSVAVPYDPEAECPVFEEFLTTIMKGDMGMVDVLLRALGYSLSGDTGAQKFFLLYGERGRNGKSTLIEVLAELLGPDLSAPLNKRLLTDTHEDNARFAMAGVEGLRFVFAEEVKASTRFDVQFLKEFAAGKVVQAERKGQDEHHFKLQAKLWYAVNSLPRVDWDNSFANRVVPIPFEQSFYNKNEPEWQEGDLPRDEELPAKLRAELPGILALLVQAAGLYFSADDGGLKLTEKIKQTALAYRSENDPVGSFLDERCREVPAGYVAKSTLFEAYDTWCIKFRFPRTNAIAFGKMLTRAAEVRGYKAQGEKSHGVPVVRGIGLIPEGEGMGEEARALPWDA